jgi:hypothetical protein
VQQAAIGDCLSFDPFPFDQNGLAPPEVYVGWRQVADVVGNEGRDLGFEIAWRLGALIVQVALDLGAFGFRCVRSLRGQERACVIR